jgi:hypothetical protein
MTWVLIVTALVNGQVLHADKTSFKTKGECLTVLKLLEQNELFKAYNAKAICEKGS